MSSRDRNSRRNNCQQMLIWSPDNPIDQTIALIVFTYMKVPELRHLVELWRRLRPEDTVGVFEGEIVNNCDWPKVEIQFAAYRRQTVCLTTTAAVRWSCWCQSCVCSVDRPIFLHIRLHLPTSSSFGSGTTLAKNKKSGYGPRLI